MLYLAVLAAAAWRWPLTARRSEQGSVNTYTGNIYLTAARTISGSIASHFSGQMP